MLFTLKSSSLSRAVATPLSLIFLSILLCATYLSAQPVSPVYTSQSPPEVEHNGDVSYTISIGNASEIVTAEHSLEIVFTYSGYQLDPEAGYSLTPVPGHWYFDSNAVINELTIDSANREITIVIGRIDTGAVSGYGEICTLTLYGGVIIIPDPDFRQAGIEAKHEAWKIAYTPTSPNLVIKHTEVHSSAYIKIELLSLSGMVMYSKRLVEGEASINTRALPRGTYILRAFDAQTHKPTFARKIMRY